MSELLKVLTEKIPEASFDLISRILPGGIVVAAVIVSQHYSGFVSALGITLVRPFDLVSIIVFAAFAYAVGLVLSALARLPNFLFWFIVFRILKAGGVDADIKKAFYDLGLGFINLSYNPSNALRVFDRAHDYIKSKSSQERSVVIKLAAEVGLLYNLLVSVFIVALLCNVSQLFWILLVLVLAAVIRSVRIWHRHASILAALSKAGP